jgi:hypothetical protein
MITFSLDAEDNRDFGDAQRHTSDRKYNAATATMRKRPR